MGGTVENASAYECHYGYGLVQAQAAENVLFRNLHGEGGATLRMETGSVSMNLSGFGGLHDIVAQNISAKNAKSAVMFGPHAFQNGVVHVDGVLAESCGYAVTVGAGSNHKAALSHLPPGTFEEVTVTNVRALFGLNARLKWQDERDVPAELQHLIGTESPDGGKSVFGPSIAAGKFKADYPASLSGVKGYGFDYTAPVLTDDTELGVGYSEDSFDNPANATNVDTDFWSARTHLKRGKNWIRVQSARADWYTSYAKADYHAVNYWGFSVDENTSLKMGSRFRYNHKPVGEITKKLNQSAFGLLLSTDPGFDAGANATATIANRGNGIGLAGGTDGLILHSQLSVDPSAGGWSDWFRMEWSMTQGAANYQGEVSLYDDADNLLFTSAPVDLGIANGTKVYAGYTTGSNTVGGRIVSFSKFKRVQSEDFIFERSLIAPAP